MSAAAQKTQEATEAENEISALLQKRHEIKEKISSPQSVELNEEIKKLKRSLEVLRENHSKARVEVSTLKAEIESVLLVNRKNLAKEIKEIEQSSADINKKIGEITQERNKLIGFVKEKEEKARELASSMNDLTILAIGRTIVGSTPADALPTMSQSSLTASSRAICGVRLVRGDAFGGVFRSSSSSA